MDPESVFGLVIIDNKGVFEVLLSSVHTASRSFHLLTVLTPTEHKVGKKGDVQRHLICLPK